eukprot:11690171-Prorocentrum_lima.AAC.1
MKQDVYWDGVGRKPKGKLSDVAPQDFTRLQIMPRASTRTPLEQRGRRAGGAEAEHRPARAE